MFNKDFYQPNRSYKVEDAVRRLEDLGYKNFTFKNLSYSNGATFYFYHEDGRIIRVSDHGLTGKRAFDVIDIRITEPTKIPSEAYTKKNETPIGLDNTNIVTGTKVRNSQFDEGVVISNDGNLIEINFNGEVKKLMAKYIKLEIIL